MDKYSRQTVKVTPEHNEECRKLLKLMGIPFIIVFFVAYRRPHARLRHSVLHYVAQEK